jgi:poly(glycerol-phosphate) alpha-glucosyltransferase
MVSPHGMLDPWAVRNSRWKKKLAYWLYERAHLQGASVMRALCESEAEAFRQFGLKTPIAIIPNGVDLPEDGEGDMLKMKGEKAGRKTLLFLGRIHPKKGLPNLIRAFAESRKSNVAVSEPWQLVIAGWDQGGHEVELVKLCEKLGLSYESRGSRIVERDSEASVVFFGPAFGHEKKSLLSTADAFVLPSFSEGLPMSVLEAWSYKLPVVMTRECNLSEGFSADAAIQIETSPESIIQGLNSLFLMSESELQLMGAKGRALVEERFTWKTVAKHVSEVYGWMIGGGNSPSCMIN